MYQLVDLTNKRIVVAGASQGIGRSTAIMLSKLGAEVILLARNEEKLKDALKELHGDNHHYFCMDFENLDDIEGTVKEFISQCGPVDGLVYSAGINNDRPLSMFKPKVVEQVMRVNLEGFIELVRALTKKNRFNPGFRIVGISSTSGLKGSRAHLAYAASKAGMIGAIQCMAVELAEKGVCANAVAPGMIRTAMYEKYLADNGGEDSPANKGLLSRQYLGIGETEDVAAAVAFLLSPAARMITGVCLPVDGGLTSC